jgi:hypothetical protein
MKNKATLRKTIFGSYILTLFEDKKNTLSKKYSLPNQTKKFMACDLLFKNMATEDCALFNDADGDVMKTLILKLAVVFAVVLLPQSSFACSSYDYGCGAYQMGGQPFYDFYTSIDTFSGSFNMGTYGGGCGSFYGGCYDPYQTTSLGSNYYSPYNYYNNFDMNYGMQSWQMNNSCGMSYGSICGGTDYMMEIETTTYYVPPTYNYNSCNSSCYSCCMTTNPYPTCPTPYIPTTPYLDYSWNTIPTNRVTLPRTVPTTLPIPSLDTYTRDSYTGIPTQRYTPRRDIPASLMSIHGAY